MAVETVQVIEDHGLNAKQHAFAIEYLKDANITQAAIRAGYSANSADVTGSRLLNHARVKAYIRSIQSKVAVISGVSRERVLKQYERLAFFDIRKFYDASGNLKSIVDLDDDTAAAITGLEIEQNAKYEEDPDDPMGLAEMPKLIKSITSTKKLKLTDMKAALDSICKMEGYNTPEAVITHGKVETVVTFKRG